MDFDSAPSTNDDEELATSRVAPRRHGELSTTDATDADVTQQSSVTITQEVLSPTTMAIPMVRLTPQAVKADGMI